MNSSECNFTGSNLYNLVTGTVSVLSVVVCLIALLIILLLRLCKIFVYRLASYQVLAGLLYEVTSALSLFQINDFTIPCVVMAYLTIYSLWLKLLLTIWLTFHLFNFAVFFKNLKRFEIPLAVFSAAFPTLIAAIPFFNDSYRAARSCWIRFLKPDCSLYIDGVLEMFLVWYMPSFVVLLISSTLLLVMMAILCYRAYKRNAPLFAKQRTALKQLVPLVFYPITFCIFTIPTIVYHLWKVLDINDEASQNSLLLVAGISNSAIGLCSSINLQIHVGVAVWSRNRLQRRPLKYGTLPSPRS